MAVRIYQMTFAANAESKWEAYIENRGLTDNEEGLEAYELHQQ